MWFRSKTLKERLSETKKVKICGVIFRIRRLNPLDYLDGSKILTETFGLYRAGNAPAESNMKKVKEHLFDVIMSGVVKPKLSRKDSGEGIFVGDILSDKEMCDELYGEIMMLTYNQKKKTLTKQSVSQDQS